MDNFIGGNHSTLRKPSINQTKACRGEYNIFLPNQIDSGENTSSFVMVTLIKYLFTNSSQTSRDTGMKSINT
jgi:hypothetical protein